MSSWQDLANELALWQAAGAPATLWWRDDDAQRAGPALERLNRLSIDYGVPLALAVIPAGADSSLAGLFDTNPQLRALQHGYAHRSHASAGERKCELGDNRPVETVCAELARGRTALSDLLGERFLPVMVPPWNRLSGGVAAGLAPAGFTGLSTLGPRPAARRDGLHLANVHVDLINWRDGRRFAGEGPVLTALCDHLRERRLGTVDRDEPTGIMTHHLAHDAGCWAFMEALLAFCRDRPVRWLGAEVVFAGDSGKG